MADTKHPAEMLADSKRHERGLTWDQLADEQLRRIPALEAERNELQCEVRAVRDALTGLRTKFEALEAERGVLMSAVEEWRKLADHQAGKLTALEAERNRYRVQRDRAEADAILSRNAIRKLEAERDKLRAKADGWDKWQALTEWVQTASGRGELPAQCLGMHRADVMRMLIDQLRANVVALKGEARVLRRLLAESRDVLATVEDDEASEQLAGLRRLIDTALDPTSREAQQMSITEASKDAQ